MGVYLMIAVHNHQPVGNFPWVFEGAFDRSYGPFLDVLKRYPDIRITLHNSGPLIDWMEQNRPEYLNTVGELADRGQIEIMGGGYYEPILSIIPETRCRDPDRSHERLYQGSVREGAGGYLDDRAGLGTDASGYHRPLGNQVYASGRYPLSLRGDWRQTSSSATTSPSIRGTRFRSSRSTGACGTRSPFASRRRRSPGSRRSPGTGRGRESSTATTGKNSDCGPAPTGGSTRRAGSSGFSRRSSKTGTGSSW